MRPEDIDQATRDMARDMNLVRVRRAPVEPPDFSGNAIVLAAVKLAALFPLAWLLMTVLAESHAAGVPVPALGYWPTLRCLACVWFVTLLVRRARWFG